MMQLAVGMGNYSWIYKTIFLWSLNNTVSRHGCHMAFTGAHSVSVDLFTT